MKKILIIGAGFLQTFVIKRAKEIGYYTITIDKNPNSIGFKYSDEYEIIDIVDKEACLNYALSKNIDGVITVATDYGVLSAAYIADQMNLPGLNYEVAKIIKNKYLVRRSLFNNDVDDISQYYEIDSINSLKKVSSLIKFPVIVKPCDGSGSKAIKRVNALSELKIACNEAIKASLVGKALIEDFIEGKEYGVESFVYNGEINVLGIMNKYMTDPPDYAELGHSFPSQLNPEEKEKMKRVVTKAIQSLNINFGAVNMDVLVTNDSRICIVDVGTRMGGNLIGSHIIPYGTGIDYMKILLGAAVGDSVELKAKRNKKAVATRILALRPGKILKLPNFDEIKKNNKVDIYHHLKIGNKIREYHNNLDGCGYVVATASDTQKAISYTKKTIEKIELGVIKE